MRKGGISMNDEVLMKILLHPESSKCPIGTQSTMIHVFEDVLSEIVKEKPYGLISELLANAEAE